MKFCEYDEVLMPLGCFGRVASMSVTTVCPGGGTLSLPCVVLVASVLGAALKIHSCCVALEIGGKP